jgi:hypothetical protein
MDDQAVQRADRRCRRFAKHPQVAFGVRNFPKGGMRRQARGCHQNAMVKDRPVPGGPIEFIQPRFHVRSAWRLRFPSLHPKPADLLEEIFVQMGELADFHKSWPAT